MVGSLRLKRKNERKDERKDERKEERNNEHIKKGRESQLRVTKKKNNGNKKRKTGSITKRTN